MGKNIHDFNNDDCTANTGITSHQIFFTLVPFPYIRNCEHFLPRSKPQ